jgi:taurine dioxygenase
MKVIPKLAPLGATVEDLDLGQPLDANDVAAIRTALLEYQVLFFPAQAIPPTEQIRFGSSFGHLERHAALDALAEHPEVVVFDTALKATTAEWWHSDVTCAPEPPMGAILQMVIAPERGGATHWASMTAAYDALDDQTKAEIEDLQARHQSWWQPVQESVHPVVRTHPESGRKGLFVNSIFTKEILGLSKDDSDELLARLIAHATNEEFVVRHDWSPGDIAFWDNRCTQHRVDNDFAPARRRGHRIAIEGDAPR